MPTMVELGIKGRQETTVTTANVAGMKVSDAIARLEGIRCGAKETSCPDQLARTLRLFL